MNQDKLKSWLYLAGIIALLALAYGCWSYTSTYADSMMMRSFSVTGEAKISVVPNVAEFDFSVTTEGGKDLVALQTQNTKKMNEIIAFLKKNKIDDEDVRTTSYNLSPRYQNINCRFDGTGVSICPPAEIIGYSLRQSGVVKVRDFTVLGGLLAGVVESGANGVSQLRFTIDDRDALLGEVKGEAIKRAQVKAKSLADTAGIRLGKLLSIEDAYTPYYGATDTFGMGGDGREMLAIKAAPAPAIEPGSQEVTASVILRYGIK
ncbi:MAG: hypothetical protein COV08_02035 [Candidatus Vogelbacteria bacterium CG10_big_fil_rev_8_21_14_0_10_49_38]|uniref:SIMPL domain-containing protein n=1 Tax=Candidatus Vogelbacteria bacterium CG10_big_fil_rev_8_21_14_0_10_49_38 TaxID=1975043 RepID=A0A2H0RHQ8_9BACT|nr:MAG: hypothetical protein BK006_02055 [bacterium CG10_49_38]PIR46033.1 MAG: hypothetical protein COV08_02035 [Candidatus Vogelbacteria bacterium CG10_big_fil_rev_8_21_14_0_10_49_38]